LRREWRSRRRRSRSCHHQKEARTVLDSLPHWGARLRRRRMGWRKKDGA